MTPRHALRPRRSPAFTLAVALFASIAGAAERPEATDPAVKRCADNAGKRLTGAKFDGDRVVAAMPRRADACILRWEKAFSASNATKVATLVVLPVNVELSGNGAHRNATLHARCGLTDSKLKAFEVVKDASC